MRRTPVAVLFTTMVALAPVAAGESRRVPTIDDLLAIERVSSPQVSPDGSMVAYVVTKADFEQDAFVTQIWLVRAATGETVQLTRGAKSASQPRWSSDGRWLAFTSSRVGDKSQVFVLRPDGGEAVQLTKTEAGVNAYEWSPDGSQIAFTAAEPESQAIKDRKAHYGDFQVVRGDYTYVHLFTLNVAEALLSPVAGVPVTKGHEFSVDSFDWSPDGKRLAFSATRTPDLVQSGTADIYVVETSGERAVRAVVSQPGPDNDPVWSLDGTQIAFRSAMGRADHYHANAVIAVVSAAGGVPRPVTGAFDENPGLAGWGSDGIYFTGLQKTSSHLFRVDPGSGRIVRITEPDGLIAVSIALSRDQRHLAFVGRSATALDEVFVSGVAPFGPRKLTAMTEQLASFVVGVPEVISWKSRDGVVIEGVLTKPADFDPAHRYPLLVQIHGGPTGIDLPALLDARYYPIDAWVGRGALVLKVNYRGSAGYGEKFRQLNVRNLGVGDAWDVLSGIEHLVARGWVDRARVGCMGWSQGGYISAFLTTTTTACAAVSVGAGISNWATYYYNTDITPFTIQYLGDDPADDPEVYRKTSPMSYIKQAKTPTLIQHGENDKRVPIANAYELRQGLEDRGVPVEMVVYKGFGHGITKPKAMRAVMWHNLDWFNHYLWGDPLAGLLTPPVPKPDAKAAEREK
jgi:dipeptidyl aminopeptidase/acylaminoacyl peptidase